MADGTSPKHSTAGSRGYVRIGLVGVISRYSTGSIALNSFNPTTHNLDRTWWVAEDFDYSTNPSNFYMLPCDNVSFNLGDVLYRNSDDAVPGTMRLRASRCGGYSFKLAFPLIMTNNTEITNAYDAVSNFIQRANYMAAMNTSIQNRNYSCILDNFNISVDGYNGANPVSCQLSTKGVSLAPDMNTYNLRSIITDTTRRDKEVRSLGNLRGSTTYNPPDITGSAATYGGRLVNIKDCALSLNGREYQQIIHMELKIQHTLELESTARAEPISEVPTIRSADRMFLKERLVTGSFKFLTSYASSIDLATIPITIALANSNSLAVRDGGQPQWASPLYMAFGPNMIFDMPAVYWQPRSEEMSTGSSLVTINFIARSNVRGINEFVSGLIGD